MNKYQYFVEHFLLHRNLKINDNVFISECSRWNIITCLSIQNSMPIFVTSQLMYLTVFWCLLYSVELKPLFNPREYIVLLSMIKGDNWYKLILANLFAFALLVCFSTEPEYTFLHYPTQELYIWFPGSCAFNPLVGYCWKLWFSWRNGQVTQSQINQRYEMLPKHGKQN